MDTVQMWTVVGSIATTTGVFSAVMFASFAVIRSSLKTVLDGFSAQIDGRFVKLEAGLDARFVKLEAGLDTRFDAVDARFEAVDARFEAVDARIDHLARVTDVRLSSLESDMHLIKAHLIGQRSA